MIEMCKQPPHTQEKNSRATSLTCGLQTTRLFLFVCEIKISVCIKCVVYGYLPMMKESGAAAVPPQSLSPSLSDQTFILQKNLSHFRFAMRIVVRIAIRIVIRNVLLASD